MPESTLRTDEDFGKFYERHREYVYRLCLTYMKTRADAEDCTEDVFVRVLTRKPAFSDDIHARKWLTVTACNHCKNKLKRRKLIETVPLYDVPEPAEEETGNDVLSAVMSLPPRYKDVIWMYYYEGYSTDEIASLLHRPASTVRNRLKDAREMLRKHLED